MRRALVGAECSMVWLYSREREMREGRSRGEEGGARWKEKRSNLQELLS